MRSRLVLAAVALAASSTATLGRAETITMYLDPNGTTSNLNVFGTVLNDGTATWPSRTSPAFRDYQFDLKTASGTATFDSFAVQLSAQLRNQTVSSGNILRASLWSGPMVPNPVLGESLVTVSTPNSGITNSSSSYSSVILTGPAFGPFAITPTPSTFFFRVWAEGDISNKGYQTKMADQSQFQSQVTMAPSAAIDGFVEYDTNFDGTINFSEQTPDPIAEVVPEPSTIVLAVSGVGLAVAATIRSRGRRRRRTA